MRWFRLLVLPLVLALASPGTACTEDEPYVRTLSPVEEPPFDYGLYANAQGLLVGEDSAVLLVRRPSHLERVYEDAQRGESRARVLFQQLEDTFVASGLHIADEVTSPRCLALPLRGCKPDWSFLDRLLPSHGPGARRLREVLGTAFSQRAHQRGMRNALITSSINALLAVTLVKGQLKGAAAEGKGALAAAEGRTLVAATTEAEVLEARLLEAEAASLEARHPAAPSELARFRPSLQSPPQGVPTTETLWSDYVAYWERRYAEVTGQGPPSAGQLAPKPPLTWGGLPRHARRLPARPEVPEFGGPDVATGAGATGDGQAPATRHEEAPTGRERLPQTPRQHRSHQCRPVIRGRGHSRLRRASTLGDLQQQEP